MTVTQVNKKAVNYEAIMNIRKGKWLWKTDQNKKYISFLNSWQKNERKKSLKNVWICVNSWLTEATTNMKG